MKYAALLLLLSAQAHADGGLCFPQEKIKEKVGKSCPSNAYFVRAAELCNKKLDEESAAAEAALAAAMNFSGEGGQGEELAKHQRNLEQLKTTVALLIASAEESKSQMIHYSEGLQMPGSVTPEEAKRLGLADFLLQFPCYRASEVSLGDNAASVEQKIASLKKLAGQTDELLARGQSGASQMGGGEVLRSPASAVAPAQPEFTSAPTPEASDITGTENKLDTLP